MEDGWLCSLVLLSSNSTVLLAADGSEINVWGRVFIVLLLLFINGFFSAAEMAVVSSNDAKIRKMAEEGNKNAKLLTRYIDDPSKFLSTIQVGITLAGFLSSAVAGDSFAGGLAWLIQPEGPSQLVSTLSLILITLITSYLSIVVGEMVPKQIALANPENFALKIVQIIRFFESLFKPFTALINVSTKGLLHLLKINPEDNQDVASEEEIRMLLDQGKRSGSIEDAESQMIVNIFEFDDKEVSEIMTHRTNIVGLDVETKLTDVINFVVHERYSRFPVYEEDIDNIIGTLHIKDLLYYLTSNFDQSYEESIKNFSLRKIVRDPYWVPESKRTNDLLKEMQNNHVSIAVVIDEYGGTAGIVTIEDLLEEIVGNIQDEYDEEDYGIHRVEKNVYQMSGMLTPEEIMRVLPQAYFPEEDDEDFDYDTIAGLILSLLGKIPEDGEKAEVSYKNMVLRVLAMDDKRIDKVELEIKCSIRQYLEEEKQKEEAEKQRAEQEREKMRQELYEDKDADKEDDWDDTDLELEDTKFIEEEEKAEKFKEQNSQNENAALSRNEDMNSKKDSEELKSEGSADARNENEVEKPTNE